MKYNILRSVAATLSVGLCTIASAQYGSAPQGPYSYAPQGQYGQQQQYAPSTQLGVPRTQSVQTFANPHYQAPAKWSNFGLNNNGPQLFQPASTGYSDSLPAPESIPTPQPNYNGGHTAQHVAPQPAPQYQTAPRQHAAPPVQQYTDGQVVHIGAPVDDAYCQSCNQAPAQQYSTPMQSQFMHAASEPWEGSSYAAQSCGVPAYAPARPQLFPWFGSFDLLFFNMDTNGKDRNLISRYDAADPTRPYLPYIGLGQLDPSSQLGYQLNFGRYFGCGQYGLGVGYFNWNPDEEVINSPVYAPLNTANGGGNVRASGMPQYHGATMAYWFDNGTQPGDSGVGYQEITGAASPYTVYDIIDGRAGQAAADGGDLDADFDGTTTVATDSFAEAVMVQARRDVDIQGIEINLFSFGLMGAQRAAYSNCGGGCGGRLGGLFSGGAGGYGGYGGGNCGGYNQCQPCGDPCAQACRPSYGFGGAGGPLVRPCTGKVQIVTSHGLRWFQFKDSIDFAYDIDGRAGFGAHDLYDNTSTSNDLFGYQFGSRLNYCVASRVNLNAGGKFGIYGNQAEFNHRLGTQENVAQLGAMPGLEIDYHTEETVFSTLGEFDLGLGFRVADGFTVRGGYRVMGVTGLASAANYSRDYSSSASASALHADTSLLLHGAYLGADFNF